MGDVVQHVRSRLNLLVQHRPNSTTRTPATDMLYNTTNGHHQRTISQFYNKFATSQCQSPTSRHVKMLGVANFRPLVVNLLYNKL